jgi:serine protease inhibitor
MRLTEQEFLDLMRKKKVQRLILPFRLPTWNQLLAMNHWQRKKVRDLIKNAVFTSTIGHNDSLIVMDGVLKPALTDSWKLEYYKTITPTSSQKLASRKKSQRQKKQSSTSFGCEPDLDNLPFG